MNRAESGGEIGKAMDPFPLRIAESTDGGGPRELKEAKRLAADAANRSADWRPEAGKSIRWRAPGLGAPSSWDCLPGARPDSLVPGCPYFFISLAASCSAFARASNSSAMVA